MLDSVSQQLQLTCEIGTCSCLHMHTLPLIDIACKFDAPFSFFGISAGTHFIVMHFSYSKPSDVIVKLSEVHSL